MSKGARKIETDAIAWNGYIIPVDQKAQYYLEVILVHWIHQRASGWIECRWITVLEIGINYLWEKIGRLFWKMFKCHCCSNRIPLYATMCVVCEFLLCITKWPYFHHNCHSLTCCIFYFDFFFCSCQHSCRSFVCGVLHHWKCLLQQQQECVAI